MLKGVAAGMGTLTLGPSFWRSALATPSPPGGGPYGPLLAPDANGLMLPDGFISRVVATSMTPVLGTTYVWHMFPDGAATFPMADGGWVLASNSEVPAPFGGAGAIRFSPSGDIISAYRILDGTGSNCAGGATPWGTWLSCEETDTGQVWECSVSAAGNGTARPALGRFKHEAAAVDPKRGHVYLTEDQGDSLFYRFTPKVRGDLSDGLLEAARWNEAGGSVTWLVVPDAAGTTPTRQQLPDATRFRRGEGIVFDSGVIYFTTTSDDRVWAYDCGATTLAIVYDAAAQDELPLHDPDNITVHRPSQDLYIAEDADNLELVVITGPGKGEGVAAPFLRITGQDGSEVAGPTFDPSGTRLYVSSQRGGLGSVTGQGAGVTYEISGPFRTRRPPRGR